MLWVLIMWFISLLCRIRMQATHPYCMRCEQGVISNYWQIASARNANRVSSSPFISGIAFASSVPKFWLCVAVGEIGCKKHAGGHKTAGPFKSTEPRRQLCLLRLGMEECVSHATLQACPSERVNVVCWLMLHDPYSLLSQCQCCEFWSSLQARLYRTYLHIVQTSTVEHRNTYIFLEWQEVPPRTKNNKQTTANQNMTQARKQDPRIQRCAKPSAGIVIATGRGAWQQQGRQSRYLWPTGWQRAKV